MILPGTVEASIPWVPGLDSDTIITAAMAQRFYGGGYKFCLRYLSLSAQSPRDLSTQEATDILNSGLALMPVQHVRGEKSGWPPDASLGREYGRNAASNAQEVGFPAGVNVWCDLENVAKTTTAQDVIAYCEAWYSEVEAAGYVPGLYVGANARLTPQQLSELSFQHYWRSQSKVPDIPQRGYQLIQFLPTVTANGIDIDLDFTQPDLRGGVSQWLRLGI